MSDAGRSGLLRGRRDTGVDGALLALLSTDASPLHPGRRDGRLRRILLATDALGLLLGLAAWFVVGSPVAADHVLWALPTVPVMLLLFNAYGLYTDGLRRVGRSTVDDIPALAHALLVCAVGLWMYFELPVPGRLGFGEVLVFGTVAFATVLGLRTAVRRAATRTLGAERVLFVGSGPMMPILARQILAQPRHGLEAVGMLTQPENGRWPLPLDDLGELGAADVEAVLRETRVERVIVSAEGLEDERLLHLIYVCRRRRIKISALPSLAAMMGPAATIDDLEGITLIGLNTSSLTRSSLALKRLLDVAGASLLLVVSAPLWIVAAIAIKLDSAGPALFRQQRIGRGGRPFQLTKFRSMVVGAERQRALLLAQSRQHNWLDLEHDPRVTRVGRVLRLSSLDELPQLWNVLKGDMSLVGPRPLIGEEDDNVDGWARGRLDLTPGITGMWQVLGRGAIPFEQMIMLDYLYVANWSLWTDIKLILRTVPLVLTHRGAN